VCTPHACVPPAPPSAQVPHAPIASSTKRITHEFSLLSCYNGIVGFQMLDLS
jgi:hypothetical protein